MIRRMTLSLLTAAALAGAPAAVARTGGASAQKVVHTYT